MLTTLARILRQITQEWPDLPTITDPEQPLSAMGLDDWDVAVAVLNAEQEFRVTLDDVTTNSINSPADLARAIDAALAKQGAAA